jgi:hypothetical protein
LRKGLLIGAYLAGLRRRFSWEFEFAVFMVFLRVSEVRNDSGMT